MYRFALVLVLSTPAFATLAATDACRVTGTAYDAAGKPLQAVVRLVDQQTLQTEFSTTDAHATFTFSDLSPDASGQRYRLDVLSPPTVVTGTHIATRSVLGIAPGFACNAGESVHADVRVQVD
jgi:hypothetical protein